MKKYIIPIILLILVLIQFNKKEITPQVISYIEDIDKINETCHINTNKLNIDLNIEYLNTIFIKKAKENIKYIDCIKYVEEAKRDLNLNCNYDMCIDKLLFKIFS